MKLYLSSYRIGDSGDRLLSLMGRGRKACVIGNALDLIPDADRQNYRATTYNPHNELGALGIESHDLDLRKYFNQPADLANDLSGYDLVWVLGGNTFLLLRAMIQSGFSKIIRPLLNQGSIVYGGFSAGACVATPTLRGIHLMDEPLRITDGYLPDPIWDGLGLVDFSIVPHFRSDHPEAEMAEKAAEYCIEMRLPFRTLQDGDVWIQDGAEGKLYPRAMPIKA